MANYQPLLVYTIFSHLQWGKHQLFWCGTSMPFSYQRIDKPHLIGWHQPLQMMGEIWPVNHSHLLGIIHPHTRWFQPCAPKRKKRAFFLNSSWFSAIDTSIWAGKNNPKWRVARVVTAHQPPYSNPSAGLHPYQLPDGFHWLGSSEWEAMCIREAHTFNTCNNTKANPNIIPPPLIHIVMQWHRGFLKPHSVGPHIHTHM